MAILENNGDTSELCEGQGNILPAINAVSGHAQR
jgi:hypothetical protein